MIVCTRLISGRPVHAAIANPVIRERMRLSRQAFDRGPVAEFRAIRSRRLLPLV